MSRICIQISVGILTYLAIAIDAHAAPCEVSRKGAAGMIIYGDILMKEKSCDGAIQISAEGLIEGVFCDGKAPPNADKYAVIKCSDGVISPAFINPHDHIKYDANPPVEYSEKFQERNDWRGLPEQPPEGGAEAVLWSEIRNVMSGTLTFADKSGRGNRILRNASDFEGGRVYYETFPLYPPTEVSVVSVKQCKYPLIDGLKLDPKKRFVAHIAEGIGQDAKNEAQCILGAKNKDSSFLVPDGSTLIHLIAADREIAGEIAKRKMNIVWAPRSNIFLYGNTAPVSLFKSLGVNIALGPDWTPSGSLNMLRELACADSFNSKYLDTSFSSRDLWWMATGAAAKALNIDDKLGQIEKGKIADLVIFRKGKGNAYGSVLHANPEDVLLVMKAGKLLYGDGALIQGLQEEADIPCEILLDVCGSKKSICLGGVSAEFKALRNENKGFYKLFRCANDTSFEPSCTPSRKGEYSGAISVDDQDGDGIPNRKDICPNIFNPIRPMDDGTQIKVCGE